MRRIQELAGVGEDQDDGRDLLDLTYGALTGGKRRPEPTPSGQGAQPTGGQGAQPSQDKKDQSSGQGAQYQSPSYLDKLKKLAGMK